MMSRVSTKALLVAIAEPWRRDYRTGGTARDGFAAEPPRSHSTSLERGEQGLRESLRAVHRTSKPTPASGRRIGVRDRGLWERGRRLSRNRLIGISPTCERSAAKSKFGARAPENAEPVRRVPEACVTVRAEPRQEMAGRSLPAESTNDAGRATPRAGSLQPPRTANVIERAPNDGFFLTFARV